jgi:hypothetical protein
MSYFRQASSSGKSNLKITAVDPGGRGEKKVRRCMIHRQKISRAGYESLVREHTAVVFCGGIWEISWRSDTKLDKYCAGLSRCYGVWWKALTMRMEQVALMVARFPSCDSKWKVYNVYNLISANVVTRAAHRTV